MYNMIPYVGPTWTCLLGKKIQDCVSKLEQTDIPRITEQLQAVNDVVLKEKQCCESQIKKLEEKRGSLQNELDNIIKMLKKIEDNEKQNIEALLAHETELRSQLDELKLKLDELKDALHKGNNVLKYDVANSLPLDVKTLPQPIGLGAQDVQNEHSVAETQQHHDESFWEKKIDAPKGILRHITQQKMREIETIAKDLESNQVQINCSLEGITVKGTEPGLTEVRQRIAELIQKIESKHHVIEKPGIATLMESELGKRKMSQVERDEDVTIVSSDESEDESDQMGGAQCGKLVQEIALCSAKPRRIHCVIGDITECDADVLVNPANKELKHVGGLSKVIVDKGGKPIQDECSDYVKRRGIMKEGDIFCSKPGNLKCRAIIHAVGPVWQDGKKQEVELLFESVFKCMETSSEKNMSSIAFSALCSGVLGMPPRIAVKTIIEAIRDFYKENKTSPVSDVYLCDVKMDIVNLFIDILKKTYGADNVTQSQNTAYDKRGNVTKSYSLPPRQPSQGVHIMVYGASQKIINEAIKSLEDSLNREYRDKEFRDKVIKDFNSSEVKRVNALRDKYDVDVFVDKRIGLIKLHGILEHLYSATDDVHTILRDVDRKRQIAIEAKLISDMVQWYFIDVTEQDLQKYSPEINLVLELAYRNHQHEATFCDNSGTKYIVDLISYEEFPESNPKDTVKVIRRNIMTDAAK